LPPKPLRGGSRICCRPFSYVAKEHAASQSAPRVARTDELNHHRYDHTWHVSLSKLDERQVVYRFIAEADLKIRPRGR